MSQKFYITTPIYYTNGAPHIGHAYTTIASDVLARLHRMSGDETYFLTGTDEHGAKVAESAKRAGKTPQIFVDEISAKFSFAWDTLNISNNRFIRTTDPAHGKAVQNTLQKMYDAGDLYLGEYEGLYCEGCEQFKQKKDLIDGKCPDHKIEPTQTAEETYLFRLSKYQDELLRRIESGKLSIRPEARRNEVMSFYQNEGLQDISFSRKNVQWGIPLPWDKTHTTYVWADAFLNYLTGLNWSGPGSEMPKLWPPDTQMMSKDILRVHATIWPAMLLSLDIPLPDQLIVHGYFTVNGQKMSKSLGNVIDPNDWVARFGSDAVRYFLLREVPFGQDGDVSEEKLIVRYNSDLANGLGNLFSRMTNLIEKNLAGVVPDILECPRDLSDIDQLTANSRFYEALVRIWEEVAWANRLVDETKLWELQKTDPQKFNYTVSSLVALLYEIAKKLSPYMPETSEKIRRALSAEKITKAEPLFPRLGE